MEKRMKGHAPGGGPSRAQHGDGQFQDVTRLEGRQRCDADWNGVSQASTSLSFSQVEDAEIHY